MATSSSKRRAASAIICFFAARRADALCRQSLQSRDRCRRPRPACSVPSPGATPGLSSRALLLEWMSASRAASPFLAARDQFQFDHAFGAEVMRDCAVEVLRGKGHEDAHRALRAPPAPRAGARSAENAASRFLLRLPPPEHKFTGSLRPAPRMACSAARNVASGPFWLTAPRPTTTLPKPGLSTSAASHGGDDHSDGINLLHVIHEVEAERFRARRHRAWQRCRAGRRWESW